MEYHFGDYVRLRDNGRVVEFNHYDFSLGGDKYFYDSEGKYHCVYDIIQLVQKYDREKVLREATREVGREVYSQVWAQVGN